jgi:hypothetical protein
VAPGGTRIYDRAINSRRVACRLFIVGLLRWQHAGRQFILGGQHAGEVVRQSLRRQETIAGNADRRVDATERLFHNDLVVLAAKDQADTGIVARFAPRVVERCEIKVHLARMLWPERSCL